MYTGIAPGLSLSPGVPHLSPHLYFGSMTYPNPLWDLGGWEEPSRKRNTSFHPFLQVKDLSPCKVPRSDREEG